MKKFIKITWQIIKDVFYGTIMLIEDNLRKTAILINLLLPYFMLYIGNNRIKQIDGKEVLIPVIAFIIIYLLKAYANKLGKGDTVPIPEERFTTEEGDGEVTIKEERLQELILYVDDVENYLERKNLL